MSVCVIPGKAKNLIARSVIPSAARNLGGKGGGVFSRFARISLAILFSTSFAYAQINLPPVEVKASLSKDKITVGDVVTYTVEVFSYPEVKLDSIPFGSNLAGFEIKKDSILPVQRLKGREIRRAVFDLTTYKIDTVTISPLAVSFRNQRGDSGGTVFSPALKLTVISLLEPDSTKRRLKAEKPPFDVGGDWWSWVLLGFWALLTLGFVIWVLKHRSAAIPERKELDLRPPWEIARAELDELLLSLPLAPENLKRFHIRLSEIFRWYAHRMYRIPAEDLTTEEQLDHLRRFLADGFWLESRQFLTFCDLVKFARWEPGEKSIADNVERLKKLIEATRPKPALESEEATAEVPA